MIAKSPIEISKIPSAMSAFPLVFVAGENSGNVCVSTVVVQASQAEQDVVQIRTATNHNHCHALTVLYYEVLRQYRVVTRAAGGTGRATFLQFLIIFFDRLIAVVLASDATSHSASFDPSAVRVNNEESTRLVVRPTSL